MSRKLVTIREVDEVRSIDGADKIELVRFGGWQCVTKKGEFAKGDKAVYFEIDSMIPADDERFSFLEKSGTRSVMGVKYYRIKTMRMRGELSQGLALPINLFGEITDDAQDLTELLRVIKYEPDMGKSRSADAKGSFPSFIKKTDAERIQNMSWRELQSLLDESFEVTVKLDGSSMTVYDHSDERGVCSRNLELKLDQDNQFPNAARAYGLLEKEWPYKNMAIQGELIGPRIQGNYEQVRENQFHVFNVWDITRQQYVHPELRNQIVTELGLVHVPVIADNITLRQFVGDDNCQTEKQFRDTIMSLADGTSIYNPQREGIVFKSHDGKVIFKVISNNYLLKNEK